ncbi:MAG TPA: LD-carboxypeptidase [Rhodospirillaceae bacterium]|nr:LD-carboxypeptidase [Rhodospirillaceae bacterium]
MALTLSKPPRLHAGDKVAAITLSWGGAGAFPARYALGKKRLKEHFDLDVVETKNALRDPAWIAANPEARADDLMEAFSDSSIKGIFSIIGGDDSIRLEPFIDLNVIARHHKVFMGFSDTTSVHFMCMEAGLSSFYGPAILSEFAENVACHPYTIESVRKTLFALDELGEIAPSPKWTGERLAWDKPENATIQRKLYPNAGPRVLQGKGTASGPLIGGCLDVLEMLRGTMLWPSLDKWKGSILFLETSEENPSPDYFRRWIRGYASMGILEKVSGILLGRPFTGHDLQELGQYDKILLEVVRDECGLTSLPIMTQMDFGHSDPKFILPYGQEAEINCGLARLFLSGAAVK